MLTNAMTKQQINWEKVLERLIEVTGAKNARDLDDMVDVPTNYSYQIKDRGMTKGYIEKVVKNVGDIDWNYVIKDERSIPVDRTTYDFIEDFISGNEIKSPHGGENFHKEILRFIGELAYASLE